MRDCSRLEELKVKEKRSQTEYQQSPVRILYRWESLTLIEWTGSDPRFAVIGSRTGKEEGVSAFTWFGSGIGCYGEIEVVYPVSGWIGLNSPIDQEALPLFAFPFRESTVNSGHGMGIKQKKRKKP